QLKNGNYVSIKLFDDIVNLLVNRQITACGMVGNCSIQYVIEGDGSVFPCDFYALDEYKLGNITTHTLKEIFNQDISFKFLEHKRVLPDRKSTRLNSSNVSISYTVFYLKTTNTSYRKHT